MRQHGAVIDCKECTVTMGGIKFALTAPTVSNSSDSVCTVTNAVKVSKTVAIPGRTVQLIQVTVPVDMTTSEVLIEQQSSNLSKHLLIPRTLTQLTGGGHAVIQVMNTSSQETTLYKGVV